MSDIGDRVKKIVYFRDGFPKSVKSNLLSECLGRVMVRERMISEDECEESLKRMRERDHFNRRHWRLLARE